MSILQAVMTAPLMSSGSGRVFIGSNSYITFGEGSDEYQDISQSNPPLPKIMISADDNSYQRVYTLVEGSAGDRTYRVRYEGTNDTSGSAGNPTIVWEIVFYESANYVFDIHIDNNNGGGYSGICRANTQITDFYSGVESISYQYVSTGQGTGDLNIITPDLHGASGMTMIFNGDEDDGFIDVNVPFPVSFDGTTY